MADINAAAKFLEKGQKLIASHADFNDTLSRVFAFLVPSCLAVRKHPKGGKIIPRTEGTAPAGSEMVVLRSRA